MDKKIINKIRQDNFLKSSFIFSLGTLVVSFLSYLYYPVLARLMDVKDFGEVQTLIAIIGQINIVFGAFSVVIVNIVANLENSEEKEKVVNELRKVSVILACIMGSFLILLSLEIRNFLNFSSVFPFILLSALLPINALFIIRTSYLQGLKKFNDVNWTNIMSTSGRLFFSVLMVVIGWRTLGVVAGLLIAQLLSLWYAYSKTKRFLDHDFDYSLKSLRQARINSELKFGLLVLLVTGFIAVLNLADMIFVKHYFSADIAGVYSGISSIGKIIFYLTSPIVAVMIPSIRMAGNAKENIIVLIKASILIFVISCGAALTFMSFPDNLISFLLGEKYLAMSDILAKVSILYILVSFVNLFGNYLLSLRKQYLSIISIVGILLIVGLNFIRHGEIIQIINNFIISGSLILAIFITVIFLSMKKNV